MEIPGDKQELLTGSVLKHVIRLAAPMIIAFMFVTSYHFVDRFFVSKLGDMATAAIGMAFTVQLVIISIGVGVGTGINSYIARNLGASQQENSKNAARHALLMAVVIGLLLMSVGLLLQRPLFKMLGAEGELLDLIVDYLTIILLFTPVNMLGMFSSSIFQGWGDTMRPMKFMLLGTLLNLALDPVLIFGLGPFPAMGMKGAALATGIGRGVSMLYILTTIVWRRKPAAISLSQFKFDRKIVAGIFQVGLPSSVSQILTSVAMGFIFYVLQPFGEIGKAAYTIVFTYEMVVFLPAIGISQAVTILTGHNFGAQLYRRVNKVYFTGIAASFSLMLLSAVVIFSSPAIFAGIFAQSPEVLTVSTKALKITSIGYVFISIYLCSVASFQGLGLGRQYLFANIFRLYVLQAPFAYFGARLFGLDGVWLGLMSVNIISALGLFLWHRFIFRFRVIPGELTSL